MSVAVVQQVITGQEQVPLSKELVTALLPDGGGVAMVRKRLPGQATRGAVLLLHGFGSNRYTWHLGQRSLSTYLAAQGYDVFNLELRGHGRSRQLGSRIPSGFEQHIDEDLPAALAAIVARGHERVFLLGHSLGGAVAYATAPRYRDLVRGVVTISGVFRWGGSTPIIKLLAQLLNRLDRVHHSLGLQAGLPIRMDLVGRWVARRSAIIEAYSRVLPLPTEGWAPGSIEREILREWLGRALDRTSGSVLSLMGRWARTDSFCDTTGDRDYSAAWAACDVPVLVIAGDRDQLAHPFYDVKPAYDISRSPDRTYRCFGSASARTSYGHIDLLVGRNAPDEVWPLISDWLSAH